MASIERLQTYLRNSARSRYETVEVAPFTLFFHPTDALTFLNYAIPDQPVADDLREPLSQLREEFVARQRVPRFEFIEEYAPELAHTLAKEGFVEESRTQLMVCTPDTYQTAPPVSGLEVLILTPESPITDVQDLLTVQRQGFDMDEAEPVTTDEAERFRRSLGSGSRGFLARFDGRPVSGGVFTAPLDGLTEVAGIATLEPFRRRGIASVVADAAVREAFSQGVEIALLSAADEQAGRVYERVGFRPRATTLAYREPEPGSS